MEQFELYRRGILRSRLSSAILLMAVPFYIAFSTLDWLFAPELWSLFLFIRIVTSLIFLGMAVAMAKKPTLFDNHVTALAHTVTLVLGVGIGYMTYRTGGLQSPYYAGLNWITIGSLAFWPSEMKDRMIIISTVYGPLAVLELLFGLHNEFNTVSLLSLTFMGGTIALSLISNVLSLKSLGEEFRLRFQLEELVRHKEQVIAVKSEESANLKRLAKQFSPAVIEAIETRAISIDQRVRQKVAIIFIDVAGSTERSTSLDYNDYQKAMDMFFDLAIKTLLSRNITVANFMGDGLMAIVNAPYAMVDYEKVAFDAAVEIMGETIKRRRTFRELWREDFHVRVGISSGYANVGFFPNSDFGVYTAIGETVNLASRLCSSTPNSTVATTKNVLLGVGDTIERCKVTKGGSINAFKGFANHNLDYFVVEPIIENVKHGAIQSCPLCAHDLFEAANLGDCILLKCTSCTYSDIQSLVIEAIAAPSKRIAS